MLFDSELKVPEGHSAIHLKDREKAKLDNPFNTCMLKELEKKPKSKTELLWSPTYEVFDGIEEGSAAAMVQLSASAKRRLEVSTLCIVVMREGFR
jgi:hypothetical protein